MQKAAENVDKYIEQFEPEIRELLTYAVSEEYFAARAKLGFSIQS